MSLSLQRKTKLSRGPPNPPHIPPSPSRECRRRCDKKPRYSRERDEPHVGAGRSRAPLVVLRRRKTRQRREDAPQNGHGIRPGEVHRLEEHLRRRQRDGHSRQRRVQRRAARPRSPSARRRTSEQVSNRAPSSRRPRRRAGWHRCAWDPRPSRCSKGSPRVTKPRPKQAHAASRTSGARSRSVSAVLMRARRRRAVR